MDLLYNILLTCILLEASNSMRNFHIPHGYLHNLAMHDNYQHNYQHYDSYSSEGMMLRSHRKKYHRNRAKYESSDSSQHYKYQCKCSCAKCNKPKLCCQDFCKQQCATQNNILVVPYPVPFIVQPPNRSEVTITTETPITTTTERVLTTTPTPESRRTLPDTLSTIAFYVRTKAGPGFKRFRIIQDKRQRRDMGSNIPRSRKFDGLPKYGIVPIPDNLAIKLMKQMRNDHKNGRKNNLII